MENPTLKKPIPEKWILDFWVKLREKEAEALRGEEMLFVKLSNEWRMKINANEETLTDIKKLISLLENPEPGISTYHEACQKIWDRIRGDFWNKAKDEIHGNR